MHYGGKCSSKIIILLYAVFFLQASETFAQLHYKTHYKLTHMLYKTLVCFKKYNWSAICWVTKNYRKYKKKGRLELFVMNYLFLSRSIDICRSCVCVLSIFSSGVGPKALFFLFPWRNDTNASPFMAVEKRYGLRGTVRILSP